MTSSERAREKAHRAYESSFAMGPITVPERHALNAALDAYHDALIEEADARRDELQDFPDSENEGVWAGDWLRFIKDEPSP